MNKAVKLLALLVLAAVLTGCAPDDSVEKPAFGYADKTFILFDEPKVNGGCEGDTEVATIETAGWGITYYTFGARVYCSRPLAFTNVLVERKTDGEWVEVGSYECKTGVMQPGWRLMPPYDLITNGIGILDVPFSFVDPGKYRITYYFLDFFIDEEDIANDIDGDRLGDEAYHVSHTYTVVEDSGSPYDILGVGCLDNPFGPAYFKVIYRCNNGKPIYFDEFFMGKLEMLDGDEWVEISGEDGGVTSSDFPEYRNYDGKLGIRCSFPDYNREYRLTLRFTENEDGSGEEYLLTLLLAFNNSASSSHEE